MKLERRTASLYVQNTGCQQCSPSYGWGPGVRNHFLLHHVIGGKGVYICRDKRHELKSGDTFLIYPLLCRRTAAVGVCLGGLRRYGCGGLRGSDGFFPRGACVFWQGQRGDPGPDGECLPGLRYVALGGDGHDGPAVRPPCLPDPDSPAGGGQRPGGPGLRPAGGGLHHHPLRGAHYGGGLGGLCLCQPQQPVPPLYQAIPDVPQEVSAGVPH